MVEIKEEGERLILVGISTGEQEDTEASLKELGALLTVPVGKSGINHRLRKISTIAEQLRESHDVGNMDVKAHAASPAGNADRNKEEQV